jgi:hypothetical protein
MEERPARSMFALATSACLASAFERYQLPVGRKCPCQPDRTVSAERADFEDSSGSLNPRQKLEQLPLIWCYIDCGKTGRGVRLQRFVQRGVVWDKAFDPDTDQRLSRVPYT